MTARRLAAALAIGLFWLGGCAMHAEAERAGDTPAGKVTILYTNDFHGRHRPFPVSPGNATAQTGDPGRAPASFARAGTVGGFAALATAVEDVRRARGAANVLLLHGGDTFSDDLLGNLTQGEAVIRLMNELGYQLAALGNHDFDYGAERTQALQEIARFPMRGANVIERATGEPFLGDPTLVLDAGGVRVGLLALGYHNTHLTGSRKNTESLRFTDGIEAARRVVPELRRRADLVVVVSHQGTKVDRLLAREVESIDLILAGHSHDLLAPPEKVGDTWIVQALSDAAVLYELELQVAGGRLAGLEGRPHTLWADRFAPHPQVAALVEALRAPHRDRLEAVIGTAAERIGRHYKSESPFDLLVGQILRQHTGAEVAFLPGVGYGVSLEPGPITREALYALLPHPSTVATLTLTGAQIRTILEQNAANLKPATPLEAVGGLVQTSGLRWAADLTRPIGARVTQVAVNGAPLEDGRRYRVVTHSGMLEGLHRYASFAQGTEIEKQDAKLTEVVEEALQGMGAVRAPALGGVAIIGMES